MAKYIEDAPFDFERLVREDERRKVEDEWERRKADKRLAHSAEQPWREP